MTSLSKNFIISFYPNLYDYYIEKTNIEEDEFIQFMDNFINDAGEMKMKMMVTTLMIMLMILTKQMMILVQKL
jgi:hypothetical protein